MAIWKRLNYVVHRWIGIALGLLVFVWFGSGIVMIYYPWPEPTASEQLARLQAFAPPSDAIGFAAARSAATRRFAQDSTTRNDATPTFAGGRLMMWNGRLTYALVRRSRRGELTGALVDARTGDVLSPIGQQDAIIAARAVVGDLPSVASVALLDHGDRYMMSGDYTAWFPAYRVRFDDRDNTAVYVGREAADVFGVVTDLTRWTTWLGTVPHWLFLDWIYQRKTLWLWLNYVLPAIMVIAGITGMVLGMYQLFPRRRRGEWRLSAYHGVSQWHHISGIVFGALVVTWSLSAIFEVLPGPRGPGRGARGRGAEFPWTAIRVSERDAAVALAAAVNEPVLPSAVDLTTLDGRPGYVFHLRGGTERWVDAETGAPRGELGADVARAIARRAVGDSAPVESADRLTQYDAYYYARPHREKPLPAWRVSFADRKHSTIYIEAVTGRVTGSVNTDTRTFRWLKDGLHSLDFPAINAKRPLWDLVLLPLMLGGTIAAFTGVWLVARRLRRMV